MPPSAPSRPATCILLATYNAGRFLDEQIDSIQKQSTADWTVLARDDGSTDGTVDRLEAWAAADRRTEIVRDAEGRLGPVGNFSRLGQVALERGARVVVFADQDDVWFEDKLARTLTLLTRTEDRLGRDTPVLVHSDLELIDGSGQRLHASFMRYQHIHHVEADPLRTLLVQNFVTGCASAINRPLLALASPVPAGAIMHDWWCALCAAARGAVVFLPTATAAYRRHGKNAVAVRGFWNTLNPAATSWAELWRTGVGNHSRAVVQAEALLERLGESGRSADPSMRIVREFVDLHRGHQTGLGRLRSAVRMRLTSQSVPRTLALYGRLLTWPG